MIEIQRIMLPQSETDTIYLLNWGMAEMYEQLTDSSHSHNFFNENSNIMNFVVCIVRFKLKNK